MLFRILNAEEEIEYRQWARKNYRPFEDIALTWHPVVRDECNKMVTEKHEEQFKELTKSVDMVLDIIAEQAEEDISVLRKNNLEG